MADRAIKRRRLFDNRGTVAVLTAMLGTVTIGFTALATDVAVWEMDSAGMQGAADHAALAAGLTIAQGMTTATAEARAVAAAEGFVHGQGTTTVTVNKPATTGPNTGVAGSIEVVVQQTEPMFFGRVLQNALPSVSSRAVALPGSINACVLALAPTGQGFNGSGAPQLHAEPCDVIINSTTACAFTASGGGAYHATNGLFGVSNLNGCISGGPTFSYTGTVTFSAPLTADPYASRPIPIPVGCLTAGPYTGNTAATIGPGTYCGGITLSANATLTLKTGVYVFDKGALDLQSNNQVLLDPADNGAGVSLVFTSSTNANYATFKIAGASSVHLTPLKTGPTAGILFWMDAAGAVPVQLSYGVLGTAGAFYAPASAAHLDQNMAVNFSCGQFIASTFTMAGSSSATFSQTNCAQYNMSGLSNGGGAGYSLRE